MTELLHFTADWCNPCKMIKPIIESFINENPDIKWTMIDVDNNLEMIKDFEIRSVPTLVVLIDGIEAKRHLGVLTKPQLAELLS